MQGATQQLTQAPGLGMRAGGCMQCSKARHKSTHHTVFLINVILSPLVVWTSAGMGASKALAASRAQAQAQAQQQAEITSTESLELVRLVPSYCSRQTTILIYINVVLLGHAGAVPSAR